MAKNCGQTDENGNFITEPCANDDKSALQSEQYKEYIERTDAIIDDIKKSQKLITDWYEHLDVYDKERTTGKILALLSDARQRINELINDA